MYFLPTFTIGRERANLFIMTILVPAAGYLLMLIPMHFYNITGESHRQMMEEIKARREALKQEIATEAE